MYMYKQTGFPAQSLRLTIGNDNMNNVCVPTQRSRRFAFYLLTQIQTSMVSDFTKKHRLNQKSDDFTKQIINWSFNCNHLGIVATFVFPFNPRPPWFTSFSVTSQQNQLACDGPPAFIAFHFILKLYSKYGCFSI